MPKLNIIDDPNHIANGGIYNYQVLNIKKKQRFSWGNAFVKLVVIIAVAFG
ncbi:MAG: hypothetical protein QNJ63_09070 [Calothrix sp. MO_192.B10]|nr:hypothetical protein [Calothrix sp. MO_192.B10]